MSWFKRITEGIKTSTADKKKHRRACGTNVLNVKKLPLQKIIR